jgi:hypothetical protein
MFFMFNALSKRIPAFRSCASYVLGVLLFAHYVLGFS